MPDFDIWFNKVRRDIDRSHRRMRVFTMFFWALWLCMFASIIVGAFLLITNPELIGQFFGRIFSGFKEVQS